MEPVSVRLGKLLGFGKVVMSRATHGLFLYVRSKWKGSKGLQDTESCSSTVPLQLC